MWVFTTAGFFSVESNGDTLEFQCVDKESADALADGIELISGDERPAVSPEAGLFYLSGITREAFAAYMSHEIENYLTYFNFHNASRDSRGERWYNQMRKIDFHIGELVDWNNEDA